MPGTSTYNDGLACNSASFPGGYAMGYSAQAVAALWWIDSQCAPVPCDWYSTIRIRHSEV
jgi:hypothetical protein